MTRTERLEQSWRNLEIDVRHKLYEANARASALAAGRKHNSEAGSTPMLFKDEIAEWAKANAYASVLDLIHTAMRELGLQYD